MAMKKPPVTIPPSGRVPEQGSGSPRLDFRDDGGSVWVSWKIITALKVLGHRAINRRREVPGEAWRAHATRGRGRGWSRALLPPPPLVAPLRLPFGLHLRLG